MSVRLPLVYIAGPFRGPTPLDVRRNVERARDWGMIVAQIGAYPVIPHTMTADFDKQLPDEFRLTGTMELLRRCDAIFLIPGWDLSSGTRAEIADATSRNQPAFYYNEGAGPLQNWVIDWQDKEDQSR